MERNNIDPPRGLPSLPEGWAWAVLGHLVSEDRGICYGIVQPGQHSSTGIPVLRVQNIVDGEIRANDHLHVAPSIEEDHLRSRLRGGEILLTLVGTCLGQVEVVPESMADFNVAQAVGVIPVARDTRYVALCLRSPMVQHFIKMWATTTVQATLNLRDVYRLPIPWPPQAERTAIARMLGALDDKIELDRKMNRTLEDMAQAIFQSWFIDSDGHTDLVESELGPIPKSWRPGTLADIAENHRNSVQPDEVDPSTPYIGLADMPQGSIALDTWGQASDATSAKTTFKAGDILFGKLRPYLKKVGVAPVGGACSSDVLVIRPKLEHWQSYTLGVLTYDPFINFVSTASTGTRMPRTSWQIMSSYKLALPPVERAVEFDEICKRFVHRLMHNVEESRTLAALRDALLPRLISGELRVPAAERVVEQAL